MDITLLCEMYLFGSFTISRVLQRIEFVSQIVYVQAQKA